MPTANGPTEGMNERYAMLQTMAEMQDAHNTLVHEQWRTQGYEYYRAMWVECAEMLDHFGWKWWKKQDGDLDQVKLELVDIWHFALSELLRNGEVDASIAEAIDGVAPALAATPEAQAEQFRLAIEALAVSCLRTRSLNCNRFWMQWPPCPWPLRSYLRSTSVKTCSTASARTMATKPASTASSGVVARTTNTSSNYLKS